MLFSLFIVCGTYCNMYRLTFIKIAMNIFSFFSSRSFLGSCWYFAHTHNAVIHIFSYFSFKYFYLKWHVEIVCSTPCPALAIHLFILKFFFLLYCITFGAAMNHCPQRDHKVWSYSNVLHYRALVWTSIFIVPYINTFLMATEIIRSLTV